jgi:hypothetical protein
MTVSLAGYPRGYIPEPQQSSFPASARTPDVSPDLSLGPYLDLPAGLSLDPWARCDSNCFRCGPGEATRLNAAGDLRPRTPQSLHVPRWSASGAPGRVHPVGFSLTSTMMRVNLCLEYHRCRGLGAMCPESGGRQVRWQSPRWSGEGKLNGMPPRRMSLGGRLLRWHFVLLHCALPGHGRSERKGEYREWLKALWPRRR